MDFCDQENEDSKLSIDEYLVNELPYTSSVDTDFLTVKQFFSKHVVTISDHIESQQYARENVFDLSDIMKCFDSNTSEECEINQKDCY